jgi:hypothetical protein
VCAHRQDNNAIKAWVTNFKAQNPGMTDTQIDAFESPDRLDWGHPNLKNCFFCAGQCWNNELDNTSCQVSMANPFGNKKKRQSDVTPTQAIQKGTLKKEYPEIAAAIANGNKLLEKRAVNDVEATLAVCGAAELNQITIIVPGFGKRYHCDQTCLAQFGTKAPTPMATPHPSQEGFNHEPTTFNGFADSTVGGPATVPSNNGNGGNAPNTAIAIAPGNNNQVTVAAMGTKCTVEGAECGKVGTAKLFCKCKVCGFKGTVCSASTGALSIALAVVVALVRLF